MSPDLQSSPKVTNRSEKMDNSGINYILTLLNDPLTLVVTSAAVAAAAIVGGVAIKFYKRNKENAHLHSNSFNTDTASSPAVTQVRFAAVVEAQLLRETGSSPDRAEKLFSDASMRWAGSEAQWNDNANRMKILPLSKCPEKQDKDVIVTFTSTMLESEIPTNNRLAMRSWLENAAAERKLVFAGLYDCPLSLNPTRFDFKEG